MKTIKIEKEVTKEYVCVKAESVEDSIEIRAILESAGEVVDDNAPYSPQNTYLMFDGIDNNWFYRWSISGYKITIPQLAELLGVEYPLKPKLKKGVWYRVEDGHLYAIIRFSGGLVSGNYGINFSGDWTDDFKIVLWDGQAYQEATPEEVEEALIAEAKRRYRPADKLSMIVQDYAPDSDGRVYPSNPKFGYGGFDRLWLVQGYSYCIFADGKWAEVIEQKQLPTLEELIAEAKSKITVKTETYSHWNNGTWEIKTYHIEGMSYPTEKRAVAAYISKKIQEEYL